MPETKKQPGPVVDPLAWLSEDADMQGERGNIGIFILPHLLVAILVGFLLWSVFPSRAGGPRNFSCGRAWLERLPAARGRAKEALERIAG